MAKGKDKLIRELSTVRDTVESVWVAIIMAFVLRAFLVEAFVIPTGSMAEQLMGEHYSLTCPACGWDFPFGRQVINKTEVSPKGNAVCPNCRYTYTSGSTPQLKGGDRVLVLKYLYHFFEPKPWDVVVFRNPQSNANNYIKRLIGLPGETIEIVHGDIFVQPENGSWQIRRKTPQAQAEMWQVIYDNDHKPDLKMLDHRGIAKPRRWTKDNDGDPWDLTANNGRSFLFEGSDTPAYISFVGCELKPSTLGKQRDDFEQAKLIEGLYSQVEAFVPHYGYDTYGQAVINLDISDRRSGEFRPEDNVDLCSDLKLSAVFRPESKDAAVRLHLAGLDYFMEARIQADGSISVWRKPRQNPKAAWEKWQEGTIPAMTLKQGYEIAFAQVDYSAIIWLNGERVLYAELPCQKDQIKKRLNATIKTPLPAPEVKLAAEGGPCELRHVKLERDVYYTFSRLSKQDKTPKNLMDYARSLDKKVDAPGWGATNHPKTLKKHTDAPDLDEFYVLGDNSPQSLDSRGWIEAAPSLRLRDKDGNPLYSLGTVPRYNLIGKAIFVYWPSGFRPPLLKNLPIVPDVGRMRLIR